MDERERTTPFPGPNAKNQQQQYKFTQEELEVLKQCNRESFYQRCLPAGLAMGSIVYYSIKSGVLKPNPRFGAVPKVVASVILGYFVGKISYQQKCAEKFMSLPNSKVGQMLRARRLGSNEELQGFDPNLSLGPFSSMTESYSDIPPSNNNTYDYDSRPSVQGLDDSFRPSLDNPIVIQEEEMPPEQKHVTTYEELRMKNREEYEQKRIASYKQTVQPPKPPPQAGTRDRDFADDYKPPTSAKNKYGDVWG